MFTLGIFIKLAEPSLKKKNNLNNLNYLIVSLLPKENSEVTISPHILCENTATLYREAQ